MAKLIRCITSDGAVMATAVDTTDIVEQAQQYHKTSAVVTAALGRLLTAAAMMGNMLKSADDSLTLRVSADGKTGSLIAVSDSSGNVRGYVMNPVVEIPLNSKGKLDVGGAVGKNGTLTVIKDLGLKEPYCGQIPLVSGEIAEDITAYYAISEQIPTVCALGVLVNPDLTVKAAGGYIIQLLPGADDKIISELEESVMALKPVTTMLTEGKTPQDIIMLALEKFETEILYTQDIFYKCDCTRERVERALVSIGAEELEQIAEQQQETQVKCHFCDKEYVFSSSDIEQLIKNGKKINK